MFFSFCVNKKNKMYFFKKVSEKNDYFVMHEKNYLFLLFLIKSSKRTCKYITKGFLQFN